MSDLIKNFLNLPSEIQQKILNGPVLTPPRDVVPNLDDPPNHTTMGITFRTICFAVASVAFMFRIYCQTKVLKTWRAKTMLV
ncbi:hypothetical protein QQS21_011026 [Conoideocrella luteorostrata]|uniref:Uncharacterized protein n=1 Tax=Conoideocrella luteorostrata TaxID=1105319 RepID=A0AAJ0CGM1_9HYPO|nr:hypothetical protein QQS21_011026 [Conoideocrella luteorostrata]